MLKNIIGFNNCKKMTNILEGVLTYRWRSSVGEHEENFFCKINVWRDLHLFPHAMREDISNASSGDILRYDFSKNKLISFSYDYIFELPINNFQYKKANISKPRLGRFYPLGLFSGLQGVFSSNSKPTRIIGIKEDTNVIMIDTNHPLSRYDIKLDFEIFQAMKKSGELGGECKDWINMAIDDGPGMQVPFEGINTDFALNEKETFDRQDNSEDKAFYHQPRLTSHIDDRCHINLIQKYSQLIIKKGAKVLDLMSSYQSHIPEFYDLEIIGLGMNIDELKANRQLKDFLLQDINENPKLPFNNESFDYVLCDLSIEYLIRPMEVLQEVHRILSKDGLLCISFSNRYFPQKVIKTWQELHDFEKLGYVIELLRQSDNFKELKTFTYRNFRRPNHDKYFGKSHISDPLYLVAAKKK